MCFIVHMILCETNSMVGVTALMHRISNARAAVHFTEAPLPCQSQRQWPSRGLKRTYICREGRKHKNEAVGGWKLWETLKP